MTHTIGQITFGRITNVRKSGDEEGVYFADIEISEAEGFPFDVCLYCARSDDYAMTGKWVYKQIIEGNFEGDIVQLPPKVDPATGQPWQIVTLPEITQPTVQGAQTL